MSEPYTLLVVDDDELNRDMLSRRLEKSGYSVKTAEDGRRALEIVDAGRVDLVLLDSMMPGLSGIEVLNTLRAMYSPDVLPVILVTAVPDTNEEVEALNSGANDYITKPVNFPVAMARIRSQLSRKQAEIGLRLSEERYALAARGANDGLWDWDLVTDQIYYSPRWVSMLGYSEGEIGPSPEEWLSRIHPHDREGIEKIISAYRRDPSLTASFEYEHRMLHKTGSYRWMLIRGIASKARNGRVARLAGSQSDITQRKAFDPLTSLPNRLHFSERLSEAIQHARESPGLTFAVLFLDVDRFKVINDSLGHPAGDSVLMEIASRLRASLRASDLVSRVSSSNVVARLGGDEFAILLEGLHCQEDATRVADRILFGMRPPLRPCGRDVFCSVSIGISIATSAYNTPEEIIRDADIALYVAKAQGKARWALFDEGMREQALNRLQLENDLQHAVERGELLVYYQPKVHIPTGQVCGFEALVRWEHPTRGLIGQSEFIPIAEETGVIVPIGFWVLRQACRQMQAWRQAYPLEPTLAVSVNLSPRQLREPGLAQMFKLILDQTGLDARCLQIEITEAVLTTDFAWAAHALHSLKALGVGLKLDDFGTGYSSLRYLKELPFDTLKIDRSFTEGLDRDEESSREMVKTILGMARNLGMEVVAEGVETFEQLEHLRSLGCEFGQGYYFLRPVTPERATEFLNRSFAAEATKMFTDTPNSCRPDLEWEPRSPSFVLQPEAARRSTNADVLPNMRCADILPVL